MDILIGIDESREVEGGEESLLMPEPASVPPAVVDFDDASGDIKEYEYWEVIERVKGCGL
jgi:hypothetical protein